MTRSSKKWWHRYRFRDRGFLPTGRLIGLFGLLLIPVLLFSSAGLGWHAFLVLNIALFTISLLDFWLIPRRSQLSCQRKLDDEIERGQPFTVRLQLSSNSRVPMRFRLIDDLPDSFQRPFPVHGGIDGTGTVSVTYHSEAEVRGDFHLEKLYVRVRSILGLWEKNMTFDCRGQIRVIPDLTKVKTFLATAQHYLLYEGERVRKKRVGSGEFTQIRRYIPGDDPRKINWRQTAKLADIMTNVYEPEHGKYVTLMLDCGRALGVESAKGNKLEYMLEGALTVAAAALKQGNFVSVIAFSDKIKAYIPAGKGMAHLQTILRGVYDLQVDPVESNYALAFQHLENVQKRRSLILLFSDLDPFVTEGMSLYYVERIRRRHVFILLGIADQRVMSWVDIDPVDTREAMVKTMAQKHVLNRLLHTSRWHRTGLNSIEVAEDRLTDSALSRYIEIMNRELV